MSFLEIAELVDSRHDKVKQTIERLVERRVIRQPPMGDMVTVQQQPRGGQREVTTSVYHVAKRDSYIVVVQISPEFTAALVDRWQELEEQVRGQQPAHSPEMPTNFADALRLAAEQADVVGKQNAQMKPKVEALDKLCPLLGSSPPHIGSMGLGDKQVRALLLIAVSMRPRSAPIRASLSPSNHKHGAVRTVV